MATLIPNSKKGQSKHTERTTIVDLTPMVDLGFLLITFFIFTTSMNTPNCLLYSTPLKDNLDSSEVKASTVLTCILDDQDYMYYYFGDSGPSNLSNMARVNMSQRNTLNMIFQTFLTQITDKKRAGLLDPNDQSLLIIKPSQNSTFQNLVDVMDEATINGVSAHCTLEPTLDEIQQISRMKELN